MKNQQKILAFWGEPVIFLLSLLVKQRKTNQNTQQLRTPPPLWRPLADSCESLQGQPWTLHLPAVFLCVLTRIPWGLCCLYGHWAEAMRLFWKVVCTADTSSCWTCLVPPTLPRPHSTCALRGQDDLLSHVSVGGDLSHLSKINSHSLFHLKIFLRFFILCGPFFKVFIEFVSVLLLLYVLIFWPRGLWDPSPLTRDGAHTPVGFEGEVLTTRAVPPNILFLNDFVYYVYYLTGNK